MNYLVIGLLVSLGWYIGKLIVDGIITEILFTRLHQAEWYLTVVGKSKDTSNRKSKSTKMKIGFYTESKE